MRASELDVRHPQTIQRQLDLLLVEDSEADAELTRHQLLASDLRSATLHHARTLDDAAGLLLEHPMDCVLLDLSLPDAEGTEGVALVSTLAPATPIVVLTGNLDEELQIDALELGAQDYLVKGVSTPDALSRAVRYSISRKNVELALARRERTDPLTGLPNERSLRQAIDEQIPTGAACAALLVDVRSLRTLNEVHSHRGGDQVLTALGARLVAMVGHDDLVARSGGDEFVILRRQQTHIDELTTLARQIVRDAGMGIAVGDELLGVALSVAVVADVHEHRDAEEVLAVAERTSRFASARDRGWEIATGAGMAASGAPRVDVSEMTDAMRLRLTPIVTMPAGLIAGVIAEASVLAEQVELVGDDLRRSISGAQQMELTCWAIHRALDAAVRLRSAGAPDLWVQIPLDAHSVDAPAVMEALNDGLQRTQLPGEAVVIDMGAATFAGTSQDTLDRIRRLGVHLCVEDVGAAISAASGPGAGLVRVVRLPPAWTAALSTEFDDRRVLRAVLGTVEAMHLQMIATGIRSREQRELLVDAGCRLGTGDYLGEATDCDSLLRSLVRHELDVAPS